MTTLNWVGQRVVRVDGVEKATGHVTYATEVVLPGMLHGKVLRSPYPHARIRRIDTSQAETMPGVVAVVTIADVPQHSSGYFLQDHHILARDKVRYVGDEVAAVAAADEDTAERAVEAIEVEYEELPAVFEVEEAMRPGAPLIHEDMAKYQLGGPLRAHPTMRTMRPGTNIAAVYKLRQGDVEAGFAQADLIVENTFRSHSAHAGHLEPHACVADYSPGGRLTVWTNNQRPHPTRVYLSHAFSLPPSRVRVIGTKVGGGFGGKSRPRYERLAAALSIRAGRPVRTVMTRAEEFICFRSPVNIARVKTGVKRDGTIVAQSIELIWDTGAYAEAYPYSFNAPKHAAGPYRVPNVSVASYLVYTNRVPAYSWRGLGVPNTMWAMESQMDIVARKLGIDPLELRLKNLVREGDTAHTGERLQAVGARECLERVAEAIGWGKELPPRRGIGLASFHLRPHVQFPSGAMVRLNDDGTILLLAEVTEIGQGGQTLLAQIVAEEMGVRVQDVITPAVDTDINPADSGAFDSRVTVSTGNALQMALAELREQVAGLASEILKVAKADLVLEKGRVQSRFYRDSEVGLTLAEVASAALSRRGGPLVGRGFYAGGHPLYFDPQTCQLEPGQSHSWKYGAMAAEVEVDPETGVVTPIRVVCAHDVGKAINPLSVEGQTEGGALMGLGFGLIEETAFDGGQVSNPSFGDYRMLTAYDTPEIQAITVESHAKDGPYGAKGVGENGPVAMAPALANAIEDAIGVRLKELPLTPEKVLAALRKP
ncbi:MAG: xanthine dehydrogenase family protein molybdopterin-binding subunit [Chloroflexi bacterium]|nr:xanthine dehydrogenase family protein molybdopterin-binding subunit [Chloroflexota bacterium]